MLRPETPPAAQPTVLKETICECGQPIMVVQGLHKGQVTAMHKKPACPAWEKRVRDGQRGRNPGFAPTRAAPSPNRKARRRAEALARRGVKP
jgi:hypothetical protein